jgi:hypothetical protein
MIDTGRNELVVRDIEDKAIRGRVPETRRFFAKTRNYNAAMPLTDSVDMMKILERRCIIHSPDRFLVANPGPVNLYS